MRTVLRDNGLAVFFGLLFLLALGGQAVAGFHAFNDDQVADGAAPASFAGYLTSSDFGTDVAENWQSEYLQFALYILATVHLVQRGSPESKPIGNQGTESDEDQQVGAHADDDSPASARARGGRLWWYSNSLGLTMGLIFLGSWAGPGRRRTRRPTTRRSCGRYQDPVGLGRVPRLARLLGPHAAELAVGVPGDPLDGRAVDLPAAAWLTGVQAGRAAHSATGLEG